MFPAATQVVHSGQLQVLSHGFRGAMPKFQKCILGIESNVGSEDNVFHLAEGMVKR